MNDYCRLCLTKCEESIEIFSEFGKEQNIAAIISKYFWFEILEIEKSFSSIICKNCWWNVDTFNRFYINIEVQHTNNGKQLFEFPFIGIGTTISNDYKDFDVSNVNNKNSATQTFIDNKTIDVKIECFNLDEQNDGEDVDDNDDNDGDHDPIDDFSTKKQKLVKKTKTATRKPKHKKPKKEPNDPVNRKKCNRLSVDERLALRNEKLVKRNVNQEKFQQEANEMRQYFDMKCELCDAVFESLTDAHQHYRVQHNHKGYLKCCGRKFFKRGSALEHIAYHLNPDTFKCTICSKTYLDRKGLDNHMEVHVPIESRQFKCTICTLSFAKKCKLTQHERVSHGDKQEKIFECDMCKRCYTTKGILAAHIRSIHQAPVCLVCDMCAKTFKSKAVLEDHRSREHLNIVLPRVQCSICGSWLTHLRALRKHVRRRHMSEPQTCLHCGKIKPNKDALRRHITSVHVHTTEMHTCTICEKSFKRAIILKEHMASHTGQALYTCPYCPKTFNSNANMHSHRKKIHPIEWENARLKRSLQ